MAHITSNHEEKTGVKRMELNIDQLRQYNRTLENSVKILKSLSMSYKTDIEELQKKNKILSYSLGGVLLVYNILLAILWRGCN